MLKDPEIPLEDKGQVGGKKSRIINVKLHTVYHIFQITLFYVPFANSFPIQYVSLKEAIDDIFLKGRMRIEMLKGAQDMGAEDHVVVARWPEAT